MATAYQTPGVYVEWLDKSAQQLVVGRTDVAGFVGLAERGPLHTAVKIESDQQFFSTFGDFTRGGYLAYAVAGFFENGGRTCWVVRAANPVGASRASIRVARPGQPTLVIAATSDGAWGNEIEIEGRWNADRVVGVVARVPQRPSLVLDFDPAPPLDPAARANLLRVPEAELPAIQEIPFVGIGAAVSAAAGDVDLQRVHGPIKLKGGADGSAAITLDHLIGDPDAEVRLGVAALDRIDDISLVAVPDLWAPAPGAEHLEVPRFRGPEVFDAQVALINACLRGGRLALLDMPPAAGDAVVQHRQGLPDTSAAAAYHPWIAVRDRLAITGLVRFVPPSGHVAGMVARVDCLRGVHKPPANEVVEGACDLRERLDDPAHGRLNAVGINALRAVAGRGLRVLGARTISSDYRWRYLNVRRLFTMIERTLDTQMQWAVFEPNNPQLWRHIDRAVRGFLERLYRLGMLDGETSEAAYFVRCDDTTNPPFNTDQGRVTCVVGLQPPYPAEFVVVRIGVTRSGIQVEERGAQDV